MAKKLHSFVLTLVKDDKSTDALIEYTVSSDTDEELQKKGTARIPEGNGKVNALVAVVETLIKNTEGI